MKLLFLINKTKINSKGEVPILCRITYLGKRKAFHTGIYVKEDEWDSKGQRLEYIPEKNDLRMSQINTQLDIIRQDFNKAFLMLQFKNEHFSIDDIFALYKGEESTEYKKLIEVFDLHINKISKLIGIDYSPATIQKFKESKMHTQSYIKFTFKKDDVPLKDLNNKFLIDFDFYMKTEKSLKQVTINKHIERLRRIIKVAISESFIERDPFVLFSPKKVNYEVIYLDQKELMQIEKHRFRQERLQKVADMFIFCCYTGLAFEEMVNLRKENIIVGFDNRKWLYIKRKKTKKNYSIPLLRRAELILNKYNVEGSNILLPNISNQNFNSYLKEIAELLNINKKVTHHTARKTFATTVLLYNDIPMEIVSELLGHSSIKVTQRHYAKVMQKKVSKEIKKLNNKLR